jgi:hypothetical protein
MRRPDAVRLVELKRADWIGNCSIQVRPINARPGSAVLQAAGYDHAVRRLYNEQRSAQIDALLMAVAVERNARKEQKL